MTLHRVGDLLLLEQLLESIEVVPSCSEPWEGKSPRELTQAFQKFSLGAPPPGGLHADETCLHEISAGPTDQLDLFLHLDLEESDNG